MDYKLKSCWLLATSDGIRTHGSPSIAHDGTQVSLVTSPIDQTLAQHPLSPTRLGTVVREQAFTLFA